MRTTAAIAAMGVALAAGCGTGRPTPASPMHVVSTTPAEGTVDVDVGVTIAVVFTVAVAPESVEGTGQILLQDQGLAVIPATVRVDPADPTRVTVDPSQPLADGVTFGLAIRSGVATPAGERLAAPLAVRFSTGPTVAAMPNWPPFDDPATAPPVSGTFVRARNEMSTGRQEAAGALLADGRVFVHGGRGSTGNALATADQYRPATDDFAAAGAGSAPVGRWGHTATLLGDGTVLLAGGDSGTAVLADSPLYAPATDAYPATSAALATARTYHTATLLTNGRVLAAGGWSGTAALASAELYDPSTGTWTATGSLATARAWHTATRLADGRVLVVGGGSGTAALGSAEIFDPATSTWTATATLAQARQRHTATLLASGAAAGLVLVAGGEQPGGSGVLGSAALFDLAGSAGAGQFAPTTASMTTPRTGHAAVFLAASGRVLVAGGSSSTLPAGVGNCSTHASAEVFDPVGGGTALGTSLAALAAQATFTGTADPNGVATAMQAVAVGRASPVAFALGHGHVLLVGGTDCSAGAPYALPTGERYIP